MPPQSRPAAAATPTPIPVRVANWPPLAGAAILSAGAIAAYARSFSVPLLFDDVDAIANNPSIRHWSTSLWAPINTTAAGRPILNLSLAINYAISGPAVWSYHVANLAIHILAGLTLLGILRRTLAPIFAGASAGISFFAALLWTLHPLQTESVTYVIQRAESLMGLFYLLTVYCFIRGAEAAARRPSLWFALCGAACLLGMASKEVMVSAPLIVLLYDRIFLAASYREALRRRWRVYAGLGATWLILPFLVFSTHGRGGSAGFAGGVSWLSYELAQFPAIARYVRLSFWPQPLVFYYGVERVKDFGEILAPAAAMFGLIAATAWAVVRPGPRGKALGFAGAWFFAILAPTSLVPIDRQTAAEHRVYLALIPVIVLAVAGIYRWLGRAALPLCVVLAIGLLGTTFRRNEDYRSALTLWTDTVAKCPENAYAHNNLGYELGQLPGRRAEAVAQYEEALRLKPDYAEPHNNLGDLLNAEGRPTEAVAELEAALALRPNYAQARNNLGNSLNGEGRPRQAIAQYEEALRLDPDYAAAHSNLGATLMAVGRPREAIAQYEEALRLQPDFAAIHFSLAVALLKIPGRTREAATQLEAALRLEPGNGPARELLAGIRAPRP